MRSKEAWKAWNNEGRPETCPMYEAKSRLRRQVRQHVKLFCAAMEERKRVRQQEAFFEPTHIFALVSHNNVASLAVHG